MVSTPMPNDQSQWAQNQPQQPSYLQQQPSIASPTQGIANLVKALYAGNDAYNQAHPAGAGPAALPPGSAVPGAMGPTAAGGPMGPSPLPPPNPDSMTGGFGNNAPMGGPMPPPQPDMSGGMAPQAPVGIDPMTQALMSPIPGM